MCPGAPNRAESGEPRFTLDGHLGTLARLLRTLGYDTSWRHPIDDSVLIEEAGEEGRILITRDTRLVKRRGLGRHLLIASNDPEEQLLEVIRGCGLRPDPDLWFTRCLVCNLPIEKISREAAAPCVPPFVLSTKQDFTRCPGCRRVYWEGTHSQRMRDRISAILSKATDETQD